MSQTLPPQQDSTPGAATCGNCQTPLSGSYCHACGQRVHEGETLRGRAAEVVTSVATPGGRFFESFVNLFTNPGALTRKYNSGKRQRFISPFATLLVAMLVLHGVQWLAGGPEQALSHEQTVTSALERADRSLGAYADGEATETPQGPAILRGEEMAARSALPEQERRERALSTRFFTDQAQRAWSPVDDAPEEFSWGKAFAASLGDLPGLFPLIGWLLLPLLLPVMIILFHRPQPASASALDHVRFLAHSLAFGALSLAAATALIIAGVSWTFVAAALALALVLHTAFHLRGAYDLGWGQAAWRILAIVLGGIVAIALLTAGLTLLRTLL